MTTLDNQKRIISLLSEVNRKGIDNLIQFIQDSDYLTTAHCHSHHKCPHGLMMHSLEVLDTMLQDNLSGIPCESLILTALCHDLGKARLNGRKGGCGDSIRAVQSAYSRDAVLNSPRMRSLPS